MRWITLAYFYASRHFKKDLVNIGASRASLVSRQWLSHPHIATNQIQKINQLEQSIQDKKDYQFLAWMPPSIPLGRKDVLFLVVLKNSSLTQIISSPTWSSDEISSLELKKTLLGNFPNLCMDEFYKNDQMYFLEWVVWELD